jgi:hypothetical protein
VHPVTSSGTTGQPVTVLHTELDRRSLWTALTLRDFEAHGIDATGHLAYLYPFTPEDFAEGRARTHSEWYDGFTELGLAGRRTDISDMTPAAELAEKVAAAQPDYLRVQPVALELMALHDRDEALAKAARKSRSSSNCHAASCKFMAAANAGAWPRPVRTAAVIMSIRRRCLSRSYAMTGHPHPWARPDGYLQRRSIITRCH